MPPDLILLAGPAGYAGGALLGLAGFEQLRRRALVGRRVVTALAAAGAVVAPGAATGLAAWDALLRAALAAGVVVLAGRSRPAWWVPAAAVAAAGTVGGGPVAQGAALALLGATVSLGAAARRMPLAGAVVGAVLVQLAFRLSWPAPTGATTAVAALALAPLVASGLRRSPRRSRRVAVRGALGVGALAVVGTVAGGVAGLASRGDFGAGADSLAAGVQAVRGGDQAATSRALSAAGRSFTAARDTLDAAWLLPARLVPVVAQHVSALQRAARAGSNLAFTGAETVAAANLDALQVRDGRIDLDLVRDLGDPVARAAAGLEHAHRTLSAAASSPWLVAPLADRLHRELARIDDSRREARIVLAVTERLPDLLGAGGPRRYFLAIQSPAELRGSGGIVGSFGEVGAEDGRLVIGRFGRDGDLNTEGTPPERRTLTGPEDYLARYARFEPQRIWQNVSVSPDFPSVGEVVAGLYPQSGGAPVDGVVSVDPTALAALLQLVGPVEVAPWPEPITAANAERILLFDQYLRLEGTARTDFLGDVAEMVARRLTQGTLPPPAALVQALAPSVRGHHLMLWSRVAGEQALFHRIGADGALPPGGGNADTVAVVNVNAGGNKLDWFLRRTSAYRARVDAGGRVTATLTVTLGNEAPPDGLPDYVIGSSFSRPVDPTGANRTYLSVYSRLRLAGATLDGTATGLESAREEGLNVYSLVLVLPPGGTRTLSLRLAGEVDDPDRYRLTWRAQPLAVPETVSVDVRSAGRVVAARPAAPLPADTTLG